MQTHKIDARPIIDRLKALTRTTTDQELSDALGVPLGTILSWKGRGSIPIGRALEICDAMGYNPSHVLYGKGRRYFDFDEGKIDLDLIAIFITLSINKAASNLDIDSKESIRNEIFGIIKNHYADWHYDLSMELKAYPGLHHDDAIKTLMSKVGLKEIWWKRNFRPSDR